MRATERFLPVKTTRRRKGVVPLATLAIAGLVAGTTGTSRAQSAEGLSPADRIAIVERWYATMDYAMLADEIAWTHAPGFFGGETLTSPAEVEEQLTPFYFEVFDDIAVDIEKVEASDASVFSFGTYNLTPKNSDEVHLAPFVHVWTVGLDGRLTGLVQYADTLLISQALTAGRVLAE